MDGTGLYYYRARYYYDAVRRRFILSDPIGLDGGLDTYAYVSNNSLRYVDPNGLLGRCDMPGTQCTPPPPGMNECAKAVARKYQHFPVNDKYKHCVVAAEIYKQCGSVTSYAASVGKELQDTVGPGNAEIEDISADIDGINCASNPQCNESPSDCCKQKGRLP